ncbi:hypothetical protein GH714_018185 [Hevea brasiliensis]|uniref:Protein kinase domain-containing protein n=1 Tax=Hevea brasiliensis TaxID=3981 RepID=A0A6A6KPR4_HEVBR|nr:hypothetical protein GH714_018185 [Hevea brasiliensis]
MINLSRLLNNSALSWDVKKQPDPCSWKGVNCSSDSSSVIGLSLNGVGISSSGFLSLVCTIESLQYLDLSVNNLSGSIPHSIGNLTKLNTLILSSNNLVGEIPQAIANISTLSRFSANQNGFVGRIPSGITRHLRFLDLSYNNLNGSIPSDLLSQSNLHTVDLSYNQLDGLIPEDISQSLVRLRLGSNLFNGSVPSLFTLNHRLTYLELDNNSLSGVIPGGLASCRNLALLNLAQNNLRGQLPVALGNISNLQVLKLQFNKLPCSLELTRQLSRVRYLTASTSWISVRTPTWTKSTGWEDSNDASEVADCFESQQQPLSRAYSKHAFTTGDLEILDLSNNKFSGEIPSFLTQLGSLTQLILSNNQLTGIIPDFKPWVSVNTSGNVGLTNVTKTNNSPEFMKKRKPLALAVILAIGAAALVGGVVLVVAVSFSRRFHRVNDQQSQSGEDLPLSQVIQGNLLTANAIHRSNIDFSKAMEAVADPWNIVLKTRFSTYYKATMPSGASYFVKKLNWSDKIFQLGSHDKFDQELEVLGKLSNSNVMAPLAYVLTVDSAFLFYEHAQKGTLFDVLHGKPGNASDWGSRYSIAVGVAQGLAFLHGYSSGPILLLDLSSRNIFLKSLKEPLVGDIELHKVIDPSKSTGSLSTVAGSVGYIPPGEQLFKLLAKLNHS